MSLHDASQVLGIAASIFGAVWAYVRFVATPAILAEVERRYINRELYDLQTGQILATLAEIKADIRDIKNRLEGVNGGK